MLPYRILILGEVGRNRLDLERKIEKLYLFKKGRLKTGDGRNRREVGR